ncbi:MAG: hypothetical protein ACLFPY_07225 [Desulfonatronovibrio sp.]
MGAYVKGSNPEIDQAVKLIKPINEFLRQDISEQFNLENSFSLLQSIIKKEK